MWAGVVYIKLHLEPNLSPFYLAISALNMQNQLTE